MRSVLLLPPLSKGETNRTPHTPVRDFWEGQQSALKILVDFIRRTRMTN
jgi:hypothetical protein